MKTLNGIAFNGEIAGIVDAPVHRLVRPGPWCGGRDVSRGDAGNRFR